MSVIAGLGLFIGGFMVGYSLFYPRFSLFYPVIPAQKGDSSLYSPGVGRKVQKEQKPGNNTFWSGNNTSSEKRIPCAPLLSVAGFLDITVLFPLCSRFISEVFPPRVYPTVLTFRE